MSFFFVFFFVIFLAIFRNEFDWEPLAMNSIKQRKRDVYIKLFDGKEVEVQTNPVCVPRLCLCARILQSRNSWKSSNRIMHEYLRSSLIGIVMRVLSRKRRKSDDKESHKKWHFFFVVAFVGYNWFSPGVFVFLTASSSASNTVRCGSMHSNDCCALWTSLRKRIIN